MKSSNPFMVAMAAVDGSVPLALAIFSVGLFRICSLGDVRTLKENSAYSTSFSPEIVSSPNSLSSSELSGILLNVCSR